MKKLLIIRHAKSSWAEAGQEDFDRPLNQRGKQDAPAMAQRLLNRQIEIDAFISSTANRAFATAYFFAQAYEKHATDVTGIQQLYHAYPPVFYQVISKLNDSIETAAIFAHNPGITFFVNELTDVKIDDMPTCSVFGVQIHCSSWKDFAEAPKEFWFFDCPKN